MYFMRFAFFLVTCSVFFSCNKDADNKARLSVNVQHEVDGDELLHDTLLYVSDAGYAYEIARVRYFLYDFKLVRADSTTVDAGGFQLVDSKSAASCTFKVNGVPFGSYVGVEFELGLSDSRDLPGALSTDPDFEDMSGPPTYLGGYHYMKYDGHFLDNDTLRPFAMYLAGTDCRIRYRLWKDFEVNFTGGKFDMAMNLGDWLRSPEDYDFILDGPRSLDAAASRQRLAANGTDVFRPR